MAEPFIHERALVDDDVVLGAGSRILQFASVTRGAVVGNDTVIWPFAMFDGSVIGRNSTMCSYTSLGPGFLIGDDAWVGPHVVLCNDAWPRRGKAGFDLARYKDRPSVAVGDGASIGAGAVVLAGVVIGPMAMIAAGAVVTRNVPAFCLLTRKGEIIDIPDEKEQERLEGRMRFASPPFTDARLTSRGGA